jgi:nicotinate-nucleotide pyrophosphorylase (carboxylating)
VTELARSTPASFEPPAPAVRRAVAAALAEDLLPLGDLTASLIAPELTGQADFVARREGVLAGTACVLETARQVGGLEARFHKKDGDRLGQGEAFGTLQGSYRSLLTAERTALNFLCHLSGVASLTARYVEAAKKANPDCQVWDTRKTTPGLRALEKAAVRAGGGVNHRGNLSEGVLIKDNHLGAASIKEAVALARQRFPGRMVEVECDRLEQVTEALSAGATLVLCDNMSPAEVEKAVALVSAHPLGMAGAVLVEASGGIDLETVGAYAAAGADLISVGALTHSAPVLDIGLDLLTDFGARDVE